MGRLHLLTIHIVGWLRKIPNIFYNTMCDMVWHLVDYYENEDVIILWDIPEYSGIEEEDENRIYRPDGKIIFKTDRQVLLLEMSVPWIDNRESKFSEKEEKYKGIIRNFFKT